MRLSKILRTGCALLLGLVLTYQGQVQAGKPLLSEEIRAAMDAGGPEAAKQRMAELYPAQKDAYQVDMQGFTQLGMNYMQSGNHAAAEAVLQMVHSVSAQTCAGVAPYGVILL